MNKIMKETVKHYTEIVDFELAKKLREAGYPQNRGYNWYDEYGYITRAYPLDGATAAPTYAEVFDWLLDKGYSCGVYLCDKNLWEGVVDPISADDIGNITDPCNSWYDTADTTIEVALELMEQEL